MLPKYITNSKYLKKCPFTAIEFYFHNNIHRSIRYDQKTELNYIAHNKSQELIKFLMQLHRDKYYNGYKFNT